LKRIIVPLSLLIAAACAVIQPPPGGPEDKTPPHIIGVYPAPDTTGIPTDAGIRVIFSEKVDEATFKERIRLYPPVAFDKLKVKGEELEIWFAEQLPETTIVVLIKGGYKDWHNVANKENFIFRFSTVESLLAGEIEGRILFKNESDSTGVVKLFEILSDSAISVKSDIESRIAFAGRDGSFAFRALPTDDASFIVWAFSDKNKDGKYADGKEFAALYPDTITLTPSRPRAEEIFINIIDPNEPGTVSGTILNETDMRRLVTVRFEPLLPGERPLVVTADSTGRYIAPKIPPGRYLVSAFIDISSDSLCGEYVSQADSTIMLEEPCFTLPDTLFIEPGEDKSLNTIKLKKSEDE
jgi:hypothetical protein